MAYSSQEEWIEVSRPKSLDPEFTCDWKLGYIHHEDMLSRISSISPVVFDRELRGALVVGF